MFSVTKAMYEDAYKADSTAKWRSIKPCKQTFLLQAKRLTTANLVVLLLLVNQLNRLRLQLGLASGVVAPSKVTAADDKGYTEFMVMSNGTFTGYDKNPAGVYDEVMLILTGLIL